MHLALYCFAAGQAVSSLKLMYRARYLALIIFGEDHPEMAQFDVSREFVLSGKAIRGKEEGEGKGEGRGNDWGEETGNSERKKNTRRM